MQNYSFVDSFAVSKKDSFIFWRGFTFPSTFTLASRNNRTSFCMLPYHPIHRLLTNVHHTSYGSLHVVTVLRKGKKACTFPGCDIGHPVLQKKQFDCYFTTDREERVVGQQDIMYLANLCVVIVLFFLLLCMTQDAGLQFYKKIKMQFCLKEGQMVTYFKKTEKNDLSQLIWTRL